MLHEKRSYRRLRGEPGHLRGSVIRRLLTRMISTTGKTSHHGAPAGLLLGLVLALAVLVGVPTAHAQAPSAPSPPPPEVQQLLNLLQDPAVRGWIDQQHQPAPMPATAEPAPPAFSTM